MTLIDDLKILFHFHAPYYLSGEAPSYDVYGTGPEYCRTCREKQLLIQRIRNREMKVNEKR